ncbi:paired amphipathic helix protein Sin3a, partial [Pancytospora epiphaga]
MSTDREKIYNGSDSEGRKRYGIYSGSDDKGLKGREGLDGQEEMHESKNISTRYYGPAQQPMVYRSQGEREPGIRSGQAMQSPRGGVSEDSDLTDAMVFLNRIKEEYSDALPVYDSFLEAMRDFKFGKIDEYEVCKAVRILFKDKPFLIRQFDDYLPHHLRYNENCGYSKQPNIPERQGYSSYRGPQYPSAQGHTMGRMMPNQHTPQVGRPGYPPYHPPVFMGRHGNPSPPMPPQSGIGKTSRQMMAENEGSKHRLANDFIQLVKKKYAAKPIIYKQFIELLQNSKSGFDKLLSQVSALLVDTPDLVERFERNFRPGSGHEEGYSAENDPLKALKAHLADKNLLGDFLKILNFYNQCYITADDLVFMLEPIIGDKECIKAFKAFIKYEEPSSNYDSSKFKDYENVGSYKIYPHPIVLNTSSALAREVLNDMCLSVSVLESEDGYVFRNKNSSEELVAKVNDERSEADLNLDRLRYLIAKLEELYANLNDNQLEMDDIEMSAALIKETLKRVYESRSNGILEAILSNPKKAIPVVLNRLHCVYKENLALHRQRRKFWREIINENYYKAYDTKGVLYRSDEKNMLSLKYVYSEAKTPISVQLNDTEMI